MRVTTVCATPTDTGGRLKYYRESAGLSREHVGVHLNRGTGSIRDWELNRRVPRYVLLVQLANLYGVPVAELIGVNSATPR
ncbi:MAG TPA: helix-turn-helix transcriptional regulator [Pseudonocardiaceae bacterium]|jgi:transcriptional regulator with XRE-family HTH domain|nr:helix-turn-helix transcriptional regulator [Pseudonocardiaceae bacterium]